MIDRQRITAANKTNRLQICVFVLWKTILELTNVSRVSFRKLVNKLYMKNVVENGKKNMKKQPGQRQARSKNQ